MHRLLKAIEGHLQVVNDALVSDQNEGGMEPFQTENHQLVLCKNALLEAIEKVNISHFMHVASLLTFS